MRVVSNAGPLIHLSWVNQIDLLPQLFDVVLVPEQVRDEVLVGNDATRGIHGVRAAFSSPWLQVYAVVDQEIEALPVGASHRGERAAIALMQQAQADLLLIDDRRAKRTAERLQLSATGTIGVLRTARNQGLLPTALPLVLQLRSFGFRVGQPLLELLEREEQGQP